MSEIPDNRPEIPELKNPSLNIEEDTTHKAQAEPVSLQTVLLDHPPVTREKIITIARNFHISDSDPIWPIVLAIREGDEKYSEAVRLIQDVCLNAPDRIRTAIEGISVANHENNQVAYEAKTMIVRIECLISDLEVEAQKEKLDRNWQHRWMIGFAGVSLFCAAWSTMECRLSQRVVSEIQSERFALIARSDVLLVLQKLLIERAQINAENEGFNKSWRSLQKSVDEDGMTENLKKSKTMLEATYIDLKTRTQKLMEKEDKAYGKTK